MGIFSFLTRGYNNDDAVYEKEEAEVRPGPLQPSGAPSGELFEGMRVNVVTKEGGHLLSGRITELAEDSLTLERLPGELSFKLATLGTGVSLNGYDKKLVPICLNATVQESSRVCLKVKNLQVVSHTENRSAFRLPLTAPVSLYRRDDDHLKNPEECQLINISTGGCCVQSEYIHMEDEVVRVRIKLDDYAPLNFLGQIVRCAEHDSGQFWYGILFAQLTEQELTSLNKILYNLQMGVRKTHMRTEEGHW